MLIQISVKGFKSLQSIENLELGIVNVFVGANGSGKTNLLEAIGLLSAAIDGEVDDQALLRRGVRTSPTHLYKSSFDRVQISAKIGINTIWHFPPNKAEYKFDTDQVDNQLSYTRIFLLNGEEQPMKWDPMKGAGASFDYVSSKPDSLKALGVLHDVAKIATDFAVYSPNTPTLRGITPDIAQRKPIGLAGGRLAEAVGELLNKKEGRFGKLDLDELFELLDWIDEIAIVPPSRELVSASVPTLREIIRFTDRWMSEEVNQLSAYDASEGALYVLFALVLAMHPDSPQLFAIDNFDQAMHPRLARASTRLFCQQMLNTEPPRQALLTTHNPLVLDGLDLRDDRIRLFAVERDAKGTTQIYRVQVSDDAIDAAQNGLSLSNLWVMGRLGGVPDLF